MIKTRYRKPGKQAAFEVALRLAQQVDPYNLPSAVQDIARQLDPKLSRADRRDVTARALRVERGRRKRQR